MESEANFNNKMQNKISNKFQTQQCAHVCRIQVNFGCNQQLACCRATIVGSAMQSGAFGSRRKNQKQNVKKNTTQNQQRISNANAAAKECSLTRRALSRNLHELLLNNSARQRRHRFQPRQERLFCFCLR
jgi:hypothetical protein